MKTRNFLNISRYKPIVLIVFIFTMMNVNAQEQKKDITHQTFNKINFKETLYKGNKTNYIRLPNEFAKTYGSFSYDSLPLDRQIAEEIRLWVSQKYKCNYCIIFHANDLKETGVDQYKINSIMAYKESHLFSAKEKAALDFAAAISDVNSEKMPSALINAQKYFSDEEIETIISCTVLMEIWARVFAVQGNVPFYTE